MCYKKPPPGPPLPIVPSKRVVKTAETCHELSTPGLGVVCDPGHSVSWSSGKVKTKEVMNMDERKGNSVVILMAEILHQLIGSLSHYLQGFIHPRWCKISAINSMDY